MQRQGGTLEERERELEEGGRWKREREGREHEMR